MVPSLPLLAPGLIAQSLLVGNAARNQGKKHQ
jgi:hypothetical protein